MIKSIHIKNFRSHIDFEMEFNQGLNVIIGENDAGKTTLIDSLKILFGNKKIDINDYNQLDSPVTIELKESDYDYFFQSKIVEGEIQNTYKLKPTEEKISQIRNLLESLNEKEELEQRPVLKNLCSLFNISYRSTTKVETIVSKIEESLSSNEYIEVKSINYPISFLGGREFENIDSFFEDTFFKELKQDIWNHKINDKTIKNHLEDYIEEFKDNQLSNENAIELNEQLKEFLPDFKEINPLISSEPNLNLKISVELLNSQNQLIRLDKMGDGTNRRTTMAIFKHKKDKNDRVYVFDEPETHLHIKAQLDILRLLKDLTKENKQIIITTHSPFLINQVNLNEIKLMRLDNEHGSKISSIDSSDMSQMALTNLGIRNIDLFFTSKLLIVEGESEEKFIPIMYEKIYGYPITHNFVKIVKAEGIKDIPNFIRILKKSFSKTDIYALMDNDADKDTKERLNHLIDEDLIHKDNIFIIGNREFEDSFPDNVIKDALSEYISDELGFSAEASLTEIQRARTAKKFSKILSNIFFRRTSKRFKKPIFAQYLAVFAEKEDIDENFIRLFESISD